MQTIDLAGSGRRTTRLGFGCSSIMGGMGRRESLQTLEWAYEAGVRHFDVAPMYGFGQAEACLGEFLASHRDVTVTTKFGIPPAKNPGIVGLARNLARPVLKAIPALKKRAQRAASAVAAAPAKRDLSVAQAQASLENSLRSLRTDRIDLFLLHDPTPDELRNNHELLEFLQRAKEQGSIAAFGIGTERAWAKAILREEPGYAPVIQREWSVFNPVDQDGAFHLYHRSLAHNRRRLEKHLAASPAIARQWSAETGADLTRPGVLSALMMRATLRLNPKALVLFSSKNRKHIRENASLSEPSPMDTQAETLYALVQQHAASIPLEADA